MAKKAPAKKAAPAPAAQASMVKLNSLSAVEQAKVSVNDLWVMKPQAAKTSARPVRAKYCGCRSVCLV